MVMVRSVRPWLTICCQESLNRGLSLFSSTMWIAGIIGFASTGYLLDHLGPPVVFIGGACLPILATGLLWSTRSDRERPTPQVQPVR